MIGIGICSVMLRSKLPVSVESDSEPNTFAGWLVCLTDFIATTTPPTSEVKTTKIAMLTTYKMRVAV